MQLRKPRLTYANVVATLALFLALGGGAAFAASTIRSGDIAPGAVQTADIHKRAITSGKLAVGAVRGNQIAPHSVGRSEIAPDAIGTSEIAPGSIRPDQLAVPVSIVAKGGGGVVQPLPVILSAYPLSGAEWTQQPGEANLIMAAVTATLTFDGSFPNGCRVFINLKANDTAIGSVELTTESTQTQSQEAAFPVAPALPPSATRANHITASIRAFGCTSESRIDSLDLQVLRVG